MTTTPVAAIPQQMQNAKANLALLLLSLGIPLLILASYSILRASLFAPGTQQPPAPLQPAPVPTTSPWQSSPEIHPPMSFGSGQNNQLIPVPTGVGTEEPFDRDVPVIDDYVVRIPSAAGISEQSNGYQTHSGLRGGK